MKMELSIVTGPIEAAAQTGAKGRPQPVPSGEEEITADTDRIVRV